HRDSHSRQPSAELPCGCCENGISTFRKAVIRFSEIFRSLEDRSMQKALAPDISTWPDESPQLIGSRCGSCGATTFPVQQRCPRCSGGEMSELLLPRSGTLVAWTTQGFPPGAPYAGPTGDDFVPFGVGLVQLGLG